MIFDSLGLPKENGATDLQDSARLAGIMTVFEWPQRVNLLYYIHSENGYVRHPFEIQYDFSRDQAACLIAGLYRQSFQNWVRREFITGRDFLSPSVRGHIRRCQGRKANWFQDLWLWLDIYWSAYVKPDAELNQLLCMLMIAGPKWVKRFTSRHKSWRENLRKYWSGWRGEPELAEWIIKKAKSA